MEYYCRDKDVNDLSKKKDKDVNEVVNNNNTCTSLLFTCLYSRASTFLLQ